MILYSHIIGFLFTSLMFIGTNEWVSKIREWIINLQPKKIEIVNRNFYVKTVEDQREDTQYIGYLEGLAKTKTFLRLNGGTKTAIAKFFDVSLPADSTRIPVALVIKEIKATNDQGWNRIAAIVEIQFEYSYLNISGELIKIPININREQANAIRISKKTYAKLISSILEDSIIQLNDEINRTNP